jgi:hypothetical protein
MAHNGEQHVGEAAGGVRADRFGNEGSDQRAADAARGRRKMVGPEPD